MLKQKGGRVESRDLSCPKGREEKPRFKDPFTQLTALPGGINLPIGQGACTGGGRWYK